MKRIGVYDVEFKVLNLASSLVYATSGSACFANEVLSCFYQDEDSTRMDILLLENDWSWHLPSCLESWSAIPGIPEYSFSCDCREPIVRSG